MVFNNHKGKVVFITGFQKNCGKTTFLNYLLSKYTSKDKIFCASIGVDAVKSDFLNPVPKPLLKMKKNWQFITNTAFLKYISTSYEIVDLLDFDVMGGKSVVISLKSDSSVMLSSVGTNSQIFDIINQKKNIFDNIFIDGAFDRITQISSFSDGEFYYVFKVEPSNIEAVKEKINFFESVMDVEISKENMDFIESMKEDYTVYNDTIFLKGALTYSKLQSLDKNAKKIILSDFTKVFLNFNDFIKIKRKYRIFFIKKFKFCGYVINLYDISIDQFEKNFDKKTAQRFIYNPYEYREIL
ncbi:MAG: hypothetical protein K6357_01490 [Elusimicrobiota bacterium]